MGLLRGKRGDGTQDIVDFEIDGLHVELAGLDLREIEDVIDDREQRGAGVVDLADVVALFRVERGFKREVGQADDGVHRRADFVAHVGEEHRLHFSRFLRLFGGLSQFFGLCGELAGLFLGLIEQFLRAQIPLEDFQTHHRHFQDFVQQGFFTLGESSKRGELEHP